MTAVAAGLDKSMRTESGSLGRAGVLLDRDGTIIVDHGYVGTIDRVEFIGGAADAIAAFNHAGLPVAVVTNQAGVARGLYGLDDVARVHRTSRSTWRGTARMSTCSSTALAIPRESSRPSLAPARTASPGQAWQRRRRQRST